MEKEVIVQIGKSGLSNNIALDIKNFLKERKPVTVRFLKSFHGSVDRKVAAEELNGLVGKKGKLIGNTVKYDYKSAKIEQTVRITRYADKEVSEEKKDAVTEPVEEESKEE